MQIGYANNPIIIQPNQVERPIVPVKQERQQLRTNEPRLVEPSNSLASERLSQNGRADFKLDDSLLVEAELQLINQQNSSQANTDTRNSAQSQREANNILVNLNPSTGNQEPRNNASINQYLATQNLPRREQLETLVGVDLYV